MTKVNQYPVPVTEDLRQRLLTLHRASPESIRYDVLHRLPTNGRLSAALPSYLLASFTEFGLPNLAQYYHLAKLESRVFAKISVVP